MLRVLDKQEHNVFGAKQPRYRHKETPTSQGFLLPRADGERYAAKVINP